VKPCSPETCPWVFTLEAVAGQSLGNIEDTRDTSSIPLDFRTADLTSLALIRWRRPPLEKYQDIKKWVKEEEKEGQLPPSFPPAFQKKREGVFVVMHRFGSVCT